MIRFALLGAGAIGRVHAANLSADPRCELAVVVDEDLDRAAALAQQFGAAATILLATRLGFPVSATHTLVGAVLGVGLARGIEALNMRAMRDIAISWVITIPAGALLTVTIFHFCLWVQGI